MFSLTIETKRFTIVFLWTLLKFTRVIGQQPLETQLVGPYVYREWYKRNNISLQNNGELITFGENFRREYVRDESVTGSAENVTLVHLGYAKLLGIYRSELATMIYGSHSALVRIRTSIRDAIAPNIANNALTVGLTTARGGLSYAYTLLNYPAGSFEKLWGGDCVVAGDLQVKECGITSASVLARSNLVVDESSNNYILPPVLLDTGLVGEPISVDKVRDLFVVTLLRRTCVYDEV